jgi:hypothetical protein
MTRAPYRVGGTVNYPGKKKRDERGRVTVPTRIVEFDPEIVFTPEDIKNAFPVVERKANGSAAQGEVDETGVPSDTMDVIRNGTGGDRSAVFWNVVIACKRIGWTIDGIAGLMERHPEGIAKKYWGRLRQEVERVYNKVETEPKGNGQADPRFRLKSFKDILLSTTPNYLVKGIIPSEGLVIAWGKPKCGKSFWVFDLTMHIALGWSYRERRVRQGSVVYLALEGGRGFSARVEAWRRCHLSSHEGEVPFYLLDVPVDLVADRDHLVQAISARELRPAVVVIDTLNRALVGSEAKDEDMAKFIRAADIVRVAFGCVVIVVHHCGIDGSRPRGHSSLSGADDAQIAISKDEAGIITAMVEHMKDGEAGATIIAKLEPVDLGFDDDGDPISSCIIVPAQAQPKMPKLPDAAKLAFEKLQEVISEAGEPPPASNHIPQGPDIRVCSAILWRETFYKAYLGKPDTKQKAFVRASTKLQELHLVGIWSETVWLTGHAGHDQ